MFEIMAKDRLNPQVIRIKVNAPLIAKKAAPGQFIILRVNDTGERIPLTVAETDQAAGTVTVIFQTVGKTTSLLAMLNVGDCLRDFVGPLGNPSRLEHIRRAAVIGGGLGCAIALPQARWLHEHGAAVDIIAGFRNKDLIILEKEMRESCQNLYVCTDDGSYGTRGFVTDMLKQCIESGAAYDEVIAIGPLPMMKFISLLTKEYEIPTSVSMNSIMIDGTGMCGGCRLTVGGETRFACVDGPDFDGHKVDFDEAIRRNAVFREREAKSMENHRCRLDPDL